MRCIFQINGNSYRQHQQQQSQYPATTTTTRVSDPHHQQHHPMLPSSGSKSNIPELSKLTEDDLRRLNESENALQSFVSDIIIAAENPLLDRYQKDIDNLKVEVNGLVKANGRLQADLDRSRNELLNKIPECHELKAEAKALSRDVEETVRGQFSTSALSHDLASGVKFDEEKSDEIAERFLRGEIDLDAFRKNYVEVRSRLHLRKAKREKLRHF